MQVDPEVLVYVPSYFVWHLVITVTLEQFVLNQSWYSQELLCLSTVFYHTAFNPLNEVWLVGL